MSTGERRLTRRGLIKAGGAGAAGAMTLGATGCLGASDEDEAAALGRDGRRPDGANVVLITLDTVRADHVGAYGSERVKTPNIDALAKESLRFTRAVPEAMPTVPARRTIFSGQRSFPFRNWKAEPGLPRSPGWMAIPDHQVTWLEVAKRAGYTTGLATDVPFVVGRPFDSFRDRIDLVEAVAGQVPLREKPKRTVPEDVVKRYQLPALEGTESAARLREYLAANVDSGRERDYIGPRTFRAGMSMLERLKGEGPFALVVDTFAPHEAWLPPDRYLALYDDVERDGIEPIQPFETPFGMVEDLGLDDDMLDRARNLYAAEITFVDAWVGRFLDKLDSLGLAEDTAVMLVSDHGMTLGERGVIGKKASNAFSEIYRVPFMIRDPGGRKAGDTSDFFASTHDIASTLLAYMDVATPGAMDGEDLSVLFAGGEPPERPYFTASYADHVLAGNDDWFLISDNQGENKRLYEREREEADLAADNGDVVDRLWGGILDDAGGTLPRLGPKGVLSEG